ncbi:hypothetical protein [Nocardia sp. NPDC127526]|uniref:hypothetical protein n=1 Tax=Nocardia sp. NPDC127526 TaxID=3345393 RepID=UPI003624BDE8
MNPATALAIECICAPPPTAIDLREFLTYVGGGFLVLVGAAPVFGLIYALHRSRTGRIGSAAAPSVHPERPEQ